MRFLAWLSTFGATLGFILMIVAPSADAKLALGITALAFTALAIVNFMKLRANARAESSK